MGAEPSSEIGRSLGRLFGEGTLAGLSDAQLVERFDSGRDELAFETLVARHGPMVLAVCRGVLRDLHSAEDRFRQPLRRLLAHSHETVRDEAAIGLLLLGDDDVVTRVRAILDRPLPDDPAASESLRERKNDAARVLKTMGR